jgi:hypothetical protein
MASTVQLMKKIRKNLLFVALFCHCFLMKKSPRTKVARWRRADGSHEDELGRVKLQNPSQSARLRRIWLYVQMMKKIHMQESVVCSIVLSLKSRGSEVEA